MARRFRAIPLVGACALLWTACAAPIDVSFDSKTDFTRFQSWDWLARRGIVVHAPFEDEAEIEQVLSRAVEDELSLRGLERTGESGDLALGVLLTAARDYQLYQETGAVETLSSLHETPSFEAQMPVSRIQVKDVCRIGVYITSRRERRLIWQATLEERAPRGCTRFADEGVRRLLERFPPG